MAGHSQFKNIMYRKGAQDAKRARLFTKLIREVSVAARTNPDPDSNPRLRAAMSAANKANMPRDNIDRAIKKASGGEAGTFFEEVRYEGFGPCGVAVIVETLTDNRNRTVGEIRAAFNKYGGGLGEANSVSFLFERKGEIIYSAEASSAENMFEMALEAGAEDVTSSEKQHEIICSSDDFAFVRDQLVHQIGEPQQAHLTWLPQTTIPVSAEKAETLIKLLDVLDDNDDVQNIFANFELSEAEILRLTA